MKEVLCFGDSNTWGYDPKTKLRYDRDTRWPCILQEELGEEILIIVEGQNGRTTVWDDPVEGQKNGMTYLLPCLESHKPLDLVVIMLGTNDLKYRFSVTAYDIARSAANLAESARVSGCGRDEGAPEVLLICPPPLGKLTEFATMFLGGTEKSLDLARFFKERVELVGCHFFDAGSAVRSSSIDGVHWEPEYHRKFSEALAPVVKRILS